MQQMTPTVGEQVLTNDGEILGEVKEVQGDRFKVDAALRRDYWLDLSAINTIELGAVCLSFAKADLDAHKREAPSS